MPVFNAEKYVDEAINSILNQSFKEFELLIVDDCSTDNTWKIIQAHAKKDKRIIPVRNAKNLYIAGNRNKLIKLAKGKYIAWQDADDISMPNRLKHQYQFLEKHPEVGIVGGFLQFFADTGNTSIRKYAPDDETLRKNIFKFSPVAQPAAMIRIKILQKAGEYNLKYPPAEDIDMSFRLGINSKFANLQETVIKYREHPKSSTFTRLKKIETSTLEIRKKYANKYGYKMSISDKIYNSLQYLSIFLIPPRMKIYFFNIFRNR